MRYSFYPGCSYHASAGYKASVDAVSKAFNIDLTPVPDWNCCGATVFMGFDKVKAATLSARVYALSQKDGFDEVITGCNACYTTLKKAALMLAKDETLFLKVRNNLAKEGLNLIKQPRVRHLLDVFANDIPPALYHMKCDNPYTHIRVAGYYGCQYSLPWGLTGGVENPGVLEQLIQHWGFKAVEHSAKTSCCGASLAVPHAADSKALITRIIRSATQAGADLMIAICPLCQFNLDSLQHHLPVKKMPILFFTQLLGLGLGISPKQLGLDKLLVPAGCLLEEQSGYTRGVFSRK